MLRSRCTWLFVAAAAAAAVMALVAAANGSATLHRRWPASDAELKRLEAKLGYTFRGEEAGAGLPCGNKWTLRLALIHPSFGEMNNARLTWLGDAVLGAAVSDLLYTGLPPNATTEQLHNSRMALVRQEACAAGAARLGLPELLVVGKGYEGQEPTARMLAEAFEAVWGAVYEDAGFRLSAVKATYARLFPVDGQNGAAVGAAATATNGSA